MMLPLLAQSARAAPGGCQTEREEYRSGRPVSSAGISRMTRFIRIPGSSLRYGAARPGGAARDRLRQRRLADAQIQPQPLRDAETPPRSPSNVFHREGAKRPPAGGPLRLPRRLPRQKAPSERPRASGPAAGAGGADPYSRGGAFEVRNWNSYNSLWLRWTSHHHQLVVRNPG